MKLFSLLALSTAVTATPLLGNLLECPLIGCLRFVQIGRILNVDKKLC
jgi:hypothetical protein